jgi:hypothetical protein
MMSASNPGRGGQGINAHCLQRIVVKIDFGIKGESTPGFICVYSAIIQDSTTGKQMNRTLAVWIFAFLITAGSAMYQRMTGPTYPLSGTVRLGGAPLLYRLERSHGGNSNAPVSVVVPDTSVRGMLEWRRYNSSDGWTRTDLRRDGEKLGGSLPLQPPAGKLEYRVILTLGADSLSIPPDAGAVMRFKGDVPPAILVVHILLMFTGMLVSTRAGLSLLSDREYTGGLTLLTIGLLASGGLVLGPIVQKYAFGAYWTGWPFGTDLTDNKTVAALGAWVAVALVQKKVHRPALWAFAAALITLAVFMIPHSLFGSELDYRGRAPGRGGASSSVSILAPADAYERAPDGGRHGRP